MFPYPRVLIALGVVCCARPVSPQIPSTGDTDVRPALAERLELRPGDRGLLDKITSRFASATPRRVHIQTDKPLYRPGDTIWMATVDLDGRTLRGHDYGEGPQPGITYTLLDPVGATVQEMLVRERRGKGSASFELPESSRGGPWTVRATAIDGTVADHEIVVLSYEAPQIKKDLEFQRDAYGPGDEVTANVEVKRATGEPLADTDLRVMLRIDGQDVDGPDVRTDGEGRGLVRFSLPDGLSSVDGLLTVVASDGGITESISKNIPIVLAGVGVDFFPEGGDLVIGLQSRVYLEARDLNGQPADIEGYIADDRGNKLAEVRTVRDGLGRVPLTPGIGRSYELVVTKPEGQQEAIPLPEARREGCVLRTVDNVEGERLALGVDVACSEPQQLVVLGSQRGQLLDAARVDVPADGATVDLLTTGDLRATQGVARVTVLTADGEPVAERIVYRNRGRDLQISLQPTAERYGPGDEVEVEITTRDADGHPVPALLSMSVVDDTVLSWADDEQGDIRSAIHLESILGAGIEDPTKYLDPDEPDSAEALELLVGVRGWRHFVREPTHLAHAVPDEAFEILPPPSIEAAPVADVAQGTVLTKDFLQSIPAGRSYQSAVSLSPGVSASRVPSAAASNENTYMLDGANITDPVTGNFSVNFNFDALPATVVSERRSFSPLRNDPQEHDYRSGLPVVASVQTIDGRAPNVYRYYSGLPSRSSASRSPAPPPPTLSRSQHQTLQQCWAEQAVRTPEIAGVAVLRFSAARAGGRSVRVNAHPRHAAVIECLEARVVGMKPRNAGTRRANVTVRYGAGVSGPALSWATVREFPVPRHSASEVRSDFRDTVWWDPAIETDAEGRATVHFGLSDAVTGFRMTAEGHAGGEVGHVEEVLESKLPFSLYVKIPGSAADTDRPRLPVVISNERDVAIDVQLDAVLGDMAVADDLHRTVTLGPGGRSTELFDVSFTHARGSVPVTFRATADGLTDEIRREIDVTPAGFEVQWSTAGTLGGKVSFDGDFSPAIPGTVLAEVKLYPSPVTGLTESMRGMIRRPGGCFEQTSSANYPNVMISQLLERDASMDPTLWKRTQEYMDVGYTRLAGFETRTGGFDWYGKAPGHVGLTAYGLIQFTDMEAVYSGVDRRMLDRTAGWLLSKANGKGGFHASTQYRWGASDEVTHAYVTWALVESGYGRALDKELDLAVHEARKTDDEYVLALLSNALLGVPRLREYGVSAALRLAEKQDDDGGWRRAAHSITMSRGRNLEVETTALATMALFRSGAAPRQVARGMLWLKSARDGYGRFGQTQATVLALRTLLADYHGDEQVTDGSLAIRVNGQDVGALTYRSDATIPAAFGLPLTAGKHQIELDGGDLELPWTAGVTYATWTPPDTAGPVKIATSLSREAVPMGETTRLTGVISNPGDRGQPVTTVHLGYGGGLSFSPRQLDDLVERGVIDAWETLPRQIIVHFRHLAPGQVVEVPVDLTAEVPGTWTSTASQAYPYYADEFKTWAPPANVVVLDPR